MEDEHPAPGGATGVRRPARRDAVVAGLAVVLSFLLFVPGPPPGEPAPAWTGIALTVSALAQGVPLLWRRLRPVPVAAAVLAAATAHGLVLGPVPPFAGWLALAAVVLHVPALGQSIRYAAAATGVYVTALALGPVVHGRGSDGLFSEYLLTVVVLLAAALLRTERGRHEALRQRAASLERERDSAHGRAAAEERLRIARDLHDLVGHGLATIAVQSSTARLLLDTGDVAAARSAVAAVEGSSRAVMGEMRQLLGVLRDAPAESRLPAPGLADLPALADGVRRAGVPVSLEVTGPVDRVPAAVGLSLHRVVQESLTNVLRHAPGASAAVRVAVERDAVRVEVRDRGGRAVDDAAEPPRAPGHGLVGIGERVHALGGEVEAGPALDGWVVRVRVPLPPRPTSPGPDEAAPQPRVPPVEPPLRAGSP